MTENAFTSAETDVVEEPAPRAEPTGDPRVDAVLESLTSLGELPVEEHVAVFEAAHDALRGALSDAGNISPSHP